MKVWLFRPFDRVAGGPALGLGLAVITITALLAWRAGLHTDGVLDLHYGPRVAAWVLLAQGMINWLILGMLMLLAGKWLGSGRFRLIDLFGTQALARWPMLLGAAWLSIPWVAEQLQTRAARLMETLPSQAEPFIAPADVSWLLVLSLPGLAAVIWMVWLMYHGFALVTNLRGPRAVLGFIAVLAVAEIASKALILLLLQSAS